MYVLFRAHEILSNKHLEHDLINNECNPFRSRVSDIHNPTKCKGHPLLKIRVTLNNPLDHGQEPLIKDERP